MKFIVDAQLPKNLAYLLREKGFDAVHTTELPGGNDTTDAEINRLSLAENRIVFPKMRIFTTAIPRKKSLTNCSILKPETLKTHSSSHSSIRIWN